MKKLFAGFFREISSPAEQCPTDEAAEALVPARSSGFDLPVDSMWSTVMVLLIEAMVRLGDVDACRTLRGAFEHQVGSNLITGSGLI